MKLSKLLHHILHIEPTLDVNVTGLTADSRIVKPGDAFLAYKGTHSDGKQFIYDAITKGAKVILSDAAENNFSNNIPIFSVPNLQHKVSQIAANFYDHPATRLRIVGITGTNGKTSCSHFLASALHSLGLTCGVIGTLGNGIYGDLKPSSLTTPDAVTLQATFATFLTQGAQAVAMEVSSHSLDQGRVANVPFEIGIFTNLSRDHLDYHGDMQQYGAAKKRLFDNQHLKHAVINYDDEFGKELIQTIGKDKSVFAYSVNQPETLNDSIIYANNVHLDINGLQAEIHSPWGSGKLQTKVIGQFNLSNLLAVFTTLCLMGFDIKEVSNTLTQLKPVPGRMEMLGGKNRAIVVVDYSHTPDALEKALVALREHCEGQLFCIFGCGGDRDRGKRPIMAQIAEQYADKVVVTDDNPRHEDPQQIVADIMQGFTRPDSVIVQHDRSKAIEDIIQCAKAGDCILVAGKGAETYQQVGDTKIPFSDVEWAGRFL